MIFGQKEALPLRGKSKVKIPTISNNGKTYKSAKLSYLTEPEPPNTSPPFCTTNSPLPGRGVFARGEFVGVT